MTSSESRLQIREVALRLREAVMQAPHMKLPDQFTLQDLFAGEVDIPVDIASFMEDVICGPYTRQKSERKFQRAKSIAADIVFAASGATKQPAKHLKLGMAIKTLTNSRRLLELLNRMGHCSSYHTVEEIETELTFQANAEHKNTPHGMELNPSLGTSVAWDNYDRFVDTQSGKDTLHDTVGIAFQIVQQPSVSQVDLTETSPGLTSSSREDTCNTNSRRKSAATRKRRRVYEATDLHIEPYRKKPCMNNPSFHRLDDPKRQANQQKLQHGKELDDRWMFCIECNPEKDTPLWAGWNSKFYSAEEPLQKIWYMKQINAPQQPTR